MWNALGLIFYHEHKTCINSSNIGASMICAIQEFIGKRQCDWVNLEFCIVEHWQKAWMYWWSWRNVTTSLFKMEFFSHVNQLLLFIVIYQSIFSNHINWSPFSNSNQGQQCMLLLASKLPQLYLSRYLYNCYWLPATVLVFILPDHAFIL